jgi:hypothetical protein
MDEIQTLISVSSQRDPHNTTVRQQYIQFPELAGAFNLLAAYTGHLHEAIERSLAANLQPYALTKHFCSHNTQICSCAHGHFDNCKLLVSSDTTLYNPCGLKRRRLSGQLNTYFTTISKS